MSAQMTHTQTIEHTTFGYRRSCSCGYKGPIRLTLSEALGDLCPVPVKAEAVL